MLTFDEARQIALRHIGPDCGLYEDSVVEKPYGWYFEYQSKVYMETGEFSAQLVGIGGFLVERDCGRLVEFGSALPAERWLADYERGFKYEAFDLTVHSVSDIQMAACLLAELGMTFVVPELVHGTIWRIPSRYSRQQLEQRLVQLPTSFLGQKFWPVTEVLARLDAADCCAYSLVEHQPRPDPGGGPSQVATASHQG